MNGIRAPEFQAFLGDVEILGLKPSEFGRDRYLIVGARSNARWWLLPAADNRAMAMGLNMFQPVSVSAHFAKFIGKTSARLGITWPIFRRDIFFTGSPNLESLFDGAVLSFAFFTGTAGPHRKTTVQIMNIFGDVLGYAKISKASAVRPFLRNESNALCRVSKMDLHTADVPKVLFLREEDQATMLVTDGVKNSRASSPSKLTSKHIEFLHELRSKTSEFGANSLIEKISKEVAFVETLDGGWSDRIKRALQTLTPRSNAIELCLAHGDFTPWNCYVQDERLYVFDWEYSDPALPTGYDVAHFILSSSSRTDQLAASSKVLTALSKTYFGENTQCARDAFLLSLICHAIFYLKRLILTDMPLSAWDDQQIRGMLIEKLIDA
jgi:thiamine kinase-like enzyme